MTSQDFLTRVVTRFVAEIDDPGPGRNRRGCSPERQPAQVIKVELLAPLYFYPFRFFAIDSIKRMR